MTHQPGQPETPAHSVPGSRTSRNVNLSDLLPRAASGIVLVVVAIGTAVLDGLSFSLLWWLAALTIHWEWQRLIGAGRPKGLLAVGSAAITAADLLLVGGHQAWSALTLVGGAVLVAVLSHRMRPLAGLGVVYAGVLPLALECLRNSQAYGLEAVLWLFAVVWGTDIMAYFGGRLVGGPKLWPGVSPSKTWSGFLVGVGSGALAGLAVSAGWNAHWQLFPLGVAAGIISQGGDLFESSLKRRFGAKDSSRIIPGHGGVMDRLDGFLAASVFAVCFGMFRYGLDASGAGLLKW